MTLTEGRADRYLTGNYAPVHEEVTAHDLPVEGTLPPALNGRLLRNGPNPAGVTRGTHHWFLGDGMIHGIELGDGKAAWYRNRWVRTDRLATELGTPAPPAGPADVAPVGNPANTHIVSHAGRILALCEVGLPFELSSTLDTVGRHDFGGGLRTPMTAHPKMDPTTGEMLFFGYSFAPPYLTYHVVDADGLLVRSEPIDIAGPSMVHDFAVTERHVVFLDLPVVFDLGLAAEGMFPFSWQPSYGARVGVMPRTGGNADVRWAPVENCYVYHPLNAYDLPDADGVPAADGPPHGQGQGRGHQVVVDVVRYDDMFAQDRHGPATQRPPTLWRWTIDAERGTVHERQLDDRPVEFPRVDDRVAGRSHRYGWATELGTGFGTASAFPGLVKYDLQAGTSEVHDLGRGRAASEGVFVPASDDAPEDEGWVLATVYDADSDTSDLVVLDAAHVTDDPVATVRLPQRVPFGFHGSWVAGSRSSAEGGRSAMPCQ